MKILVVGPSWVGDMVMAQCLFISLKQQYPESIIDVLAPAWSRPILERMPEVRRAVAMPLGHGMLGLGERKQLGLSLRGEAYDWSITLPRSLKSALVPAWAKIPKRTGWRGEWRYGLLNDIRVLDKQRYPLMIERFIAHAFSKETNLAEVHAEGLPRPRLSVDENNSCAALDSFNLNRSRPILALCPGAEFGEAKRWPAAYYAQVAQAKIDAGWQVWLFGSEKDQPGCAQIQQALSPEAQAQCTSLAGRTTLADAIDLLALADAVVSNDSGLMHVAAALHRPLVVVYGSTSPKYTPPLNDQHQIVSLGLACSPCFKRECPLKHSDCLKKLGSSLVLEALAKLPQPQVVQNISAGPKQ